MDKNQSELWRQRLLEEEARLTEQIRQAEAGEYDELHVAQSILNVSRSLLPQVHYAIQRCDLGTYGTCEMCGNDIEEDRLGVVPYASTCSNCAHNAQLMTKMRQQMAQQGYANIPRRVQEKEGQRDDIEYFTRFQSIRR